MYGKAVHTLTFINVNIKRYFQEHEKKLQFQIKNQFLVNLIKNSILDEGPFRSV